MHSINGVYWALFTFCLEAQSLHATLYSSGMAYVIRREHNWSYKAKCMISPFGIMCFLPNLTFFGLFLCGHDSSRDQSIVTKSSSPLKACIGPYSALWYPSQGIQRDQSNLLHSPYSSIRFYHPLNIHMFTRDQTTFPPAH